MRNTHTLVGLLGFLLTGCAGVGIVETSDPLTKLNDAEYLFMREDRPLPAERLIREAIAIYQERNDSLGLGNAYRDYGDLLSSPAVMKWEVVYRRDGFLDKSVRYDNRDVKAAEDYKKALGYYRSAEQKFQASARYDALTNVYINMAWSYEGLNNSVKACGYYDRALDAYNENIRRNPGAKPYSPSGTVPEFINSMKKRAHCA